MKRTLAKIALVSLAVAAPFAFSGTFSGTENLGAVQQGHEIRARLEGKGAKERANIKRDEIWSTTGPETFTRKGLTIEVQAVEKIEGGVQVLARAWKGSKQLGFGKDGSVEIERFRIYNPPVLVPSGAKETVTSAAGKTHEVNAMREDPSEALRLTLADTIALVGKEDAQIESGKIGRTTSTFYPDANPESTSVDASFGKADANLAWATLRNTATASGGSDSTASAEIALLRAAVTSNLWRQMFRGWFLFDTSAIGDDDTVDSATFSLFGTARSSASWNQSLVIDSPSPTSNTQIVSGDFDITKWAGVEQSSTRIAWGSWNTTGYNNFTLNAAGLATISKVGVSKFGTRGSGDFDNSEPTWAAGEGEDSVASRMADQAGTTEDPKLVVVHTGAAPATSEEESWFHPF